MPDTVTDALTASSVGRRLAAWRKVAGFRTTQELADAVPNERITGAVIRNIESGRKSDLSVAQLLDLSGALRISPLSLLVPIGRPESKVDWPNVGAEVAGMSVVDFTSWVTQESVSDKQTTLVRYSNDGRLISSIGNFYGLLDRREEAKEMLAEAKTYAEGNPEYDKSVEYYEMMLASIQNEIDQSAQFLTRRGVDLGSLLD